MKSENLDNTLDLDITEEDHQQDKLLPDLWLSDRLIERIDISSGVGVLRGEIASRAGYADNSILPVGPWKAPEATYSKCLFGLSQYRCPWSRGIGIGTVTGELRNSVEYIRALNLSNTADANAFMSSPEFSQFKNLFKTFLEGRSLWPLSGADILKICVRPHGWATTTIDPEHKCRIGLHVDTWDGGDFRWRDLCRNRISINLGREDRFFVFCNVTVTTILAIITAFSGATHGSSNALINHFFELFPKYPVLRLRVAPGEFYVAPTENIIHDATSFGKLEADVSVAGLGYFDCNIPI
jgi:hypothetical protein